MEVVANLASVAFLFLLPRAKPSALPLLPFSDFYLHRSEGTLPLWQPILFLFKQPEEILFFIVENRIN
jgi:hypothetical protein